MPGYNPDGYHDWRDMTIGEALHALKFKLIAVLLALGLIEDYGDEGINGTDQIGRRNNEERNT